MLPGALGLTFGFFNCMCRGGGMMFLSGSDWNNPATFARGFCRRGTWGNSNFLEGWAGLNCSRSALGLQRDPQLVLVNSGSPKRTHKY